MAFQSSVTLEPAKLAEGRISDLNQSEVVSKSASEAIPVGRACVQASDDAECALPTALAADATAVVDTDSALGDGSGTTPTVLATGKNLNPARNVTITLGNDANWDATTAVVTGRNEHGEEISESFTIPDGGDATVTGSSLFSTIYSVTFPAQSGDAPGSVGLGTKAGRIKLLGVSLDDVRFSAEDSSSTYAAGDLVAMCREGRMAVITEDACTAGGDVFVRVVAGGAEELGAFRASPDGSPGAPDAVKVSHAKFLQSKGAGELVEIELNLKGL